MSLKQEDKLQELKTAEAKERRGFLKKTAYAAPTLIVLGGLIKPRNANALPNPPSDPQTNTWRRP